MRRLRICLAATAALLSVSVLVPEGAGAFGVDSVMRGIFGHGGEPEGVTPGFVSWIIGIPNFSGSRVERLQGTVTAISFGLLGAIFTVAVLRFFLAGFSSAGGGGVQIVDALTRSVGAALFIVAWPAIFDNAVALSNLTSAAILSDAARADTAILLGLAIGGSGVAMAAVPIVGWVLVAVIAVAASVLLVGLVVMKVVMAVSLSVIYVGAAIPAALWPLTELSWVARFTMRALTTVLLLPVIWAIGFATAAALGVNALTFSGGPGLLDKVIQPVVALALFWVVIFLLPKQLAAAARGGSGGGGGGALRHAGGYAMGRQALSAAQPFIPQALGGMKGAAANMLVTSNPATGEITGVRSQQTVKPDSPEGRQALQWAAQAAATGGAGAAKAGAAKAGAGGSGTGTPASGQGAAPGAGQAAPTRPPGPRDGSLVQGGAAPQAFSQEMQQAAAQAAENPPRRDQVAAAFESLPDESRSRIWSAWSSQGGDVRGLLAEAAASNETAPEHREALRTLAAAPQATRTLGMYDASAPPARRDAE
jgi:hypothetical protein